MRLVLALGLGLACFGQETYDIVIAGGRIVDGSGNPWFCGDVAIQGDRIVRIAPRGMLSEAPARERIDAAGMVVAPGFIDIQSHSRAPYLTGDSRVVSKVTMGVTTEILGEGVTNAPANDKTAAIAGLGTVQMPAFQGARGFDAWLRTLEARGTSTNFGSFVGGATIRAYVKGLDRGEPSGAEIGEMRELVRQAMEQGAFGIATALIYPPGEYAGKTELVEMAKAMAPYGGIYITHMRSEADRLLQAIEEASEIGRSAGVPVEIYHLKAAGKRNWHKAVSAVAAIESARAAGQDVAADMYPYTAGGTGLTACLPPWTAEGGKLFDHLADSEARGRIRRDIDANSGEWENLCELATPEGVLIAETKNENNREYQGKRLSEIAKMMGKDWIDAAMDLILADRTRVQTTFFMMNEGNVRMQMRQPWIKFGTDAGGLDPASAEGVAHPRAYGTYTRILGRYVRDEGVIPLEDAIRKMSSAVAQRLFIRDRGLLREGMLADVIVFDPGSIIDLATFENPHQLSRGVQYVFVNGTAVVRAGKHTDAKPGRIVRGPGYKPQAASE